jgi:hypothetical protein
MCLWSYLSICMYVNIYMCVYGHIHLYVYLTTAAISARGSLIPFKNTAGDLYIIYGSIYEYAYLHICTYLFIEYIYMSYIYMYISSWISVPIQKNSRWFIIMSMSISSYVFMVIFAYICEYYNHGIYI